MPSPPESHPPPFVFATTIASLYCYSVNFTPHRSFVVFRVLLILFSCKAIVPYIQKYNPIASPAAPKSSHSANPPAPLTAQSAHHRKPLLLLASTTHSFAHSLRRTQQTSPNSLSWIQHSMVLTISPNKSSNRAQ
jgi:hypothetical protein